MDCSICNESFDDKEHKPHSINPCGHCFCLKCIRLLTIRSLCPKCRGNIQSTIVNYAILDMLNDAPRTSRTSNPIRESRIFQSLDNMLSKMTELDQSLDDTLKKRISYINLCVNNMKDKIQKDTEKKVNALLNDNQKLLSQLEEKNAAAIEQLRRLSEDTLIKRDLRQFQMNFSKLNFSELSEKSTNFERDVEQRIKDLNRFKLNISLELYPNTIEENQIGRIVELKMASIFTPNFIRQSTFANNKNSYHELSRPISSNLPRLTNLPKRQLLSTPTINNNNNNNNERPIINQRKNENEEEIIRPITPSERARLASERFNGCNPS
jgi:hypothetical protein